MVKLESTQPFTRYFLFKRQDFIKSTTPALLFKRLSQCDKTDLKWQNATKIQPFVSGLTVHHLHVHLQFTQPHSFRLCGCVSGWLCLSGGWGCVTVFVWGVRVCDCVCEGVWLCLCGCEAGWLCLITLWILRDLLSFSLTFQIFSFLAGVLKNVSAGLPTLSNKGIRYYK